MQKFIEYLDGKGIAHTFTKQGNLNFEANGRAFQLSTGGWFRSSSGKRPNTGWNWYIVFKEGDSHVKSKYDTFYSDRRHAVQFCLNDGSIDSARLISKIEKAELF